MWAIKSTGIGGRTAGATPFGNFMGNMPYLVPFSVLETVVFIAMIIIGIEVFREAIDPILDLKINPA